MDNTPDSKQVYYSQVYHSNSGAAPGKNSLRSGGTPAATSAYITEAFSFLQADEYSAYTRVSSPPMEGQAASTTPCLLSVRSLGQRRTVSPPSVASSGNNHGDSGFYRTNITIGAENNANNNSKKSDVYCVSTDVASRSDKGARQWNRVHHGSDRTDGKQKGCCSKKACLIASAVILALLVVAGVVAAVLVLLLGADDTSVTTTTQQPTTAEEYFQFEVMIRLNETWTNDLLNTTSISYISLSSQLVHHLKHILDNSFLNDSFALSDLVFRQGSIEATVQLHLTKSSTLNDVIDVLVNGFVQLQDSDQLPWSMDPKNDIYVTRPSSPVVTAESTTTESSNLTSTHLESSPGVTIETYSTPEETSDSRLPLTTGRSLESSLTTTGSGFSSEFESSPMTTTEFTMSSAATELPESSPMATSEQLTEFSTIQAVSTTTTQTYTETRKRTTPPPATCEALREDKCLALGKHSIGFPNARGQSNQNDASLVLQDYIYYSEYGCYDRESVMVYGCAYLFPECDPVTGKLLLPCRSFCEDFVAHCKYPSPCTMLPEDDDNCVRIPGSSSSTATAPPFTNPCSVDQFLCGNDRCVLTAVQCDGYDDCGDFSDEIHCGEADTQLDCDFDNPDGDELCYFRRDLDSFYNWTVVQGSSLTPETGPYYDHTTRSPTGRYLLAEASGQVWQDHAVISSPVLLFDSHHCFRFYYYMHGEGVDHLEVSIMDVDTGKHEAVFVRRRSFDDKWRHGQVDIAGEKQVVLSFRALRGSNHFADIALDDLTARPGHCPNVGCATDEFTCNNGICLPEAYVCDRTNDCSDFSDEIKCECAVDEFRCNMGVCIPLYQRCDQQYQCPDETDEVNCVCPLGQYACGDGKCIMSEWICDGEVDCKSGEDEDDCGNCTSSQFECSSYGCVDKSATCDGVVDCADGSDEHTCIRQRSSAVQLHREGQWLPVCADGLPSSVDASLCQHMGYGSVEQRSAVTLSSSSYMLYDVTAANDTTLLQRFHVRDSCPGSRALTLDCLRSQCGYQKYNRSGDVSPFIVNGRDAATGEWPWQIGLFVNNIFTCGGSLISQRHVLTAAHCLTRGSSPSIYKVIMGSIYRLASDSNKRTIPVEDYTIHEQYEAFYQGNDIAILTLKQDIRFNDFIQPICLPKADDVISLSSLCYTSGWGLTDSNDDLSQARILQEGKSRLWSPKKCMEAYSFVDGRMQCAGYDSGHIANCPGDSGGPLVCRDLFGKWSQIGVFSFITNGCNVPMRPPVFSRVQAFLSWIEEKTTCQFTCDNGRCLWNINDVCDGKDDCGDSSDEIAVCQARNISCNFDDDDYKCGYTHPTTGPLSKWSRVRQGTTNVGPIVDHTKGNGTGYFMYGGAGTTFLMAPLYHNDAPHCFRFRHHLRTASAATLHVFAVPVNDSLFLPANVDLGQRQILHTVQGYQVDLWFESSVDLPAGTRVIGFESRSSNDNSGIAVDDVELLPGTCESQVCPPDHSTCQRDSVCYAQTEGCNYHIYCIDETDELDCQVKKPYICDFENYGSCGLEQDVFDGQDWEIKLFDPAMSNGPIQPPNGPGHYVYLNTKSSQTVNSASISLPVNTPEVPSCLKFNFMMVSQGSLSFKYLQSSSDYVPSWSQLKANHSKWVSIEISVPVGVRLVTIDGIPGADDEQDRIGFMAMDDFIITTGQCDKPVCGRLQWTCNDGSCIDNHFVCDGFDDCLDKSDESADTCVCMPDSFVCNDYSCLRGHVRCNGVGNCLDESDEVTCDGPCREDEYTCLDGTCRHRSTWCDGISDCLDGSDELPTCQCFPEQYQCVDKEQCIPGFRKCDGFIDCKDGSDETPGCGCDERWHFKCVTSGKCIPIDFRCNAISDCADGSDEHCVCDENEYLCINGNCIDGSLYCDGFPDCQYGEDEESDCECGAGMFKCHTGGCIPNANVCDGVYNCFDKSDERNNCTCSDSEFRCGDGLCIPSYRVCDGVKHCEDYSDEADCDCKVGEFQCKTGLCISNIYECDGQDQCGDESDEQTCASCQREEYRCPDGRCIQSSWVCDGYDDCVNGTEETACSNCLPENWQCANYQCIEAARRCDGYVDCLDQSDEARCLRIVDVESVTNVLQTYRSDQLLPICASNWPPSWSNTVCQSLGQGLSAISTGSSKLSVAKYLAIPQNRSVDDFNIGAWILSDTCVDNEVVTIECESSLCGQPVSYPAPFIIGGDIANEGAWPWSGSLLYLGRAQCSVTVIDADWVVTAAHCMTWHLNGYSLEYLPHYFTVRLGSTYLNADSSSALTVGVKQIHIHPTYFYKALSGMQYEDIALIQLDTTLTFTDKIRPACLPRETHSFTQISLCYTTGWGFTSLEDTEAVDQLREARMTLQSTLQCANQQAWGTEHKPQTQLCAGYTNGYISTCNVDSGGGLVCRDENNRWTLVGVTSVGPSSCGQVTPPIAAKPGIFTRTSAYVSWIQNIIGG